LNLGPHEIHVWLAFDRGIDDPRRLARYAELLTAEDILRRDKLHFEHDRHQFVVTRALQRLVLSRYASEVKPGDWRFTVGEHGKPALASGFERRELHFNIAHTAGLVALAVSRMHRIGVDVENARARSAPLHLAQRYFTPTETDSLATLSAHQQPARFFALWTLKEAWLKATGRGLAAGLGNVSFDLDDTHRVRSVAFASDEAIHWRFWQFLPSPEHVLALALHSAPTPPDVTVMLRKFPADLPGS
jgi:4'-phosphopantetheinyl transferase